MSYVTPGAGALVAVRGSGGGGSTSPRGGAPAPVYQIDFTAVASGKRIANSKRRVRWRFGFANVEALENGETGTACRGEEHDITLVWSVTSGKRLVLADGHEVHYSNNRGQIFEFSWTMRGNHVLKIVAHASPPLNGPPGFRQYDFFVDGQSFFNMPKVYRLGLNGNAPVTAGAGEAPMAHRSPTYSNYDATGDRRASGGIRDIEAPHNADEERAYLEEAIKNSLAEAAAPAAGNPGSLADTSSVASGRSSHRSSHVTQQQQQQQPAAPAPAANDEEPDLLDFGAIVPSDTQQSYAAQNGLAPQQQPVAANGYAAPAAAPAYGMPQQQGTTPFDAPAAAPAYGQVPPAAASADPFASYGAQQAAPAPAATDPFSAGAAQMYAAAPVQAPAAAVDPFSASGQAAYGAQQQQPAAASDPFGGGGVQAYGAPAPAQQAPAAPAPAADPFGAAPASDPFGAAPASDPFGAAPASDPFAAAPAAEMPQQQQQQQSAQEQQQQPAIPNVFSSSFSVDQQQGGSVSLVGGPEQPSSGSLADEAYNKLASTDFGLGGGGSNPFDSIPASSAAQPTLSGMKAMQPAGTQTAQKKEVMKAPAAPGAMVIAGQQPGNWGGGPPALNNTMGAGYGYGGQQQPMQQAAGGYGYNAAAAGTNGYGYGQQQQQPMQQQPPAPLQQPQQQYQQPQQMQQQYQQPMQQQQQQYQQPQQGYGAPQYQQQY